MSPTRVAGAEFWSTPRRLRCYLLVVAVAALTLPLLLSTPVQTPHAPVWLTVSALFGVSVVNVEVSRWLSGGIAYTHQPHKALSAWAFASAMLLPISLLLVVVPVTYAHARWRGIRLTLWKWVGSGMFLILSGVVAGLIRHRLMGTDANWTQGDGHIGFVTMLLAGIAFLAVETALFAGSALLNTASDEVWLRSMLTSPSFYLTEAGVLLVGGLFATVWAAGFWFTLFFVPVYFMTQHAALLAPLRERAAVAAELAEKNAELAAMNKILAAANTDLDEANTFKTDLMSMLGHEIGNPLTSVLGYAQIGAEAAASGDSATARSALVVVERNARRMRAVLADIIRIVTSERGVLTARPERVSLHQVLLAAVDELPPEQRPSVACPTDLGVLAQPGHLDQIIANLLSNAEKYAGGATELTATVIAGGHVEVAVLDRGPGIPAEFRDHLFERFRRDTGTAAKVKGTGIGLYISRELARANAGDLVHDEVAADGCRFVLRLPAAS